MFSSLSHWIKGLASPPSRSPTERQRDAQLEVPPPPFLPAERIHQLELCQDSDQSFHNATANSGFFQRLPPDIRRLILIEAFGDRIVHVDLRLLEFGGLLEEYDLIHGSNRGSDRHKDGKSTLTSSFDAPPQWRWYGCVCHREPERHVRKRTLMNKSLSPPWFDACLDTARDSVITRSRRVCGQWSGEEPRKCQVGAMGWLRTCRQA